MFLSQFASFSVNSNDGNYVELVSRKGRLEVVVQKTTKQPANVVTIIKCFQDPNPRLSKSNQASA
jgi:hypothetical protein